MLRGSWPRRSAASDGAAPRAARAVSGRRPARRARIGPRPRAARRGFRGAERKVTVAMRHPFMRVCALLVIGCVTGLAQAQPTSPLTLESPNARIRVRVLVGDRVTYTIDVDDRAVTGACTLSMQIDQQVLGAAARLRAATPSSHDATVEPPVRQKAARLRDHYNALRLDFEANYAIVFRAYDEGVAYRFETTLPAAEVKVVSEDVGLTFAEDFVVFYPEEQSFFSHNERHYLPRALSDLAPKNIASLPAVVDARGVKIAIAESDVESYPGMWLRGTSATRARRDVPAVCPRGDAHARSRPPRHEGGRLHRRHDGDAHLSVARARDCRQRWRAHHELARLPARVAIEGRRHLVDSPGQGRVGLVERQQHLRRRLRGRHQHRHLQALHRLRRRARARVRDPRRGMVHARQRARRRARDRRGRTDRVRGEQARGHHPLGCLEHTRRAVGPRARPVPAMGREGHQGRLHAARRPESGRLLPPRQPPGG